MRPGSWTLTAALLLGVGASVAEAQPMTRGGRPTGAPRPSEIWNRMIGNEPKTKTDAKTKSAKPASKKPAAEEKPATEEKPAVEKPVDRFEREQRAFLRRLAVCDKLRQIALKNNDDALFRQADELQDRAWALCLERTGMEPVDDADSTIDQRILDQRLEAESRGTRVDRLYTVPRERSSSLATQEEQP